MGIAGGFFPWPYPEDFSHHPDRRHEDVRGIGEERGLVALNEMADPRHGKCQRNQQHTNDGMKPHYKQRREARWNSQHVQRAIHRMIVGMVIMRIKTHKVLLSSSKRYFTE